MVTFYKPNSNNNGSACSFYASDDGAFMVSLLRQFSWNDKTKKASFSQNRGKEKGNIVIKLSALEVANLILSIDTKVDFKGYHKSPSSPTASSIRFGLYKDKNTGEPKGGYAFGIFQTFQKTGEKNSMFILLGDAEVIYLREYLVYYLHRSFDRSAQALKAKRNSNKPAEQEQPNQPVAAFTDDGDMW
mgnify:CR=1 FL=1